MIPRRAISVLSLVRDKHFQEQDYMENQKTFLYSPLELYLSKMVLYMSSREFRSLLYWWDTERWVIYCSLDTLSRNDQITELHESFTNNLIILTLRKSGINLV